MRTFEKTRKSRQFDPRSECNTSALHSFILHRTSVFYLYVIDQYSNSFVLISSIYSDRQRIHPNQWHLRKIPPFDQCKGHSMIKNFHYHISKIIPFLIITDKTHISFFCQHKHEFWEFGTYSKHQRTQRSLMCISSEKIIRKWQKVLTYSFFIMFVCWLFVHAMLLLVDLSFCFSVSFNGKYFSDGFQLLNWIKCPTETWLQVNVLNCIFV